MITPNDIADQLEVIYTGKCSNTYENKLLLIASIRAYFMGLERDSLVRPGCTVDIDVDAQAQYLASKGIDTSEMTEQEIREADTGTHVFLAIAPAAENQMEG